MRSAGFPTIDAAGRVVIPKGVRSVAGLEPGTPLQIRVVDGVVEITPAPRSVQVDTSGSVLVARPIEDGPRLDVATVKATRRRIRDDRAR